MLVPGITSISPASGPAAGTLLTINGSGHLNVEIRVPVWAQNGYTVSINDADQSISADPGTYISLEREWVDGDQISIEMPFDFNLERTPDDADIAGILYGPVVLAGDSSSSSYIDLSLDTQDLSQSIFPTADPLRFTVDGLDLMPFYDAQNIPYHAYFQVN